MSLIPYRSLMLCTLLASSLLAPSYADNKQSAVPMLPAYQQECAACHIAYPPQFLPAASWQALMQNLPRHFGSDASLDPQMVAQLSTWLSAHAARSQRMANRPPEDRITTSNWFVREHREVSARIWQLSTVNKGANCAACHTRAAQGDFNERYIRLPQ
mgnify:CR=1 FL=1